MLVATEPIKARTAPTDVDIGLGPVSGERVGPRNPRAIKRWGGFDGIDLAGSGGPTEQGAARASKN